MRTGTSLALAAVMLLASSPAQAQLAQGVSRIGQAMEQRRQSCEHLWKTGQRHGATFDEHMDACVNEISDAVGAAVTDNIWFLGVLAIAGAYVLTTMLKLPAIAALAGLGPFWRYLAVVPLLNLLTLSKIEEVYRNQD